MERTEVYKIRDLFRHVIDNKLSFRKIADTLHMGKSTVCELAVRIKKINLTCIEIALLTDTDLLKLLDMSQQNQSDKYKNLSKNFAIYEKELKRTGVTIKLLWEEYKKANLDGYSASQFAHHFQMWRGTTKATMKFDHKAGDKMFLDFTGKKLCITDRLTLRQTPVEVFVSILPASSYTYLEATPSQENINLIKCTENAFWYYGGVTTAIVPDCLKSAVTKGSKYEPQINRSYHNFAEHYQTTVLPARPYSAKDKAAVEGAVKIIYQWIFAKIRDKVFYTIEELNCELWKLLEEYNSKPMQRTGISRKQMFDDVEKTTLKPLPFQYYTPKKYAKLTVAFNYHIFLSDDNRYYSVPHPYIKKKVDVVYTDTDLEIYYNNIRIASHKRSNSTNRYTTVNEHMPPHHKFYKSWSHEKFMSWAYGIGEDTKNLIEKVLGTKEHPEQGFKVCLGILNLAKKYSKMDLNKVCKKALYYQTYTLKFVKNSLENNLLEIEDKELFEGISIVHKNIRGSEYYKNNWRDL